MCVCGSHYREHGTLRSPFHFVRYQMDRAHTRGNQGNDGSETGSVGGYGLRRDSRGQGRPSQQVLIRPLAGHFVLCGGGEEPCEWRVERRPPDVEVSGAAHASTSHQAAWRVLPLARPATEPLRVWVS